MTNLSVSALVLGNRCRAHMRRALCGETCPLIAIEVWNIWLPLLYCSCSLLFGHAGHLVLLGLPLGWYERVGRIMGDCVSILDDSALNWGGSDLICAGSLAVARSDLRCSVSSCSVSGK